MPASPAKRSKQSTPYGSNLWRKLPAKNIAKTARTDYLVFMVVTKEIQVKTKGNCDIIDITGQVSKAIAESGIPAGTATIFNVGSTAGITTTEYEPGLVKHDIKDAFEKLAPRDGQYEHNKTWDDDNGYAHVRASMLGPSLVVPIVGGKLTLGTWQQIVLIDFDTRPRTRRLICQIIGD